MNSPNSALSPTRSFAGFSSKILVWIMLVVLGLIAAIAIAPSLIDQEKLRARLLQDLGEISGGPLQSNGALSVSYIPEFKVTLADVASANPNAPVHLKAKTIEFGLAPWPALIGKIESSAVRFDDATLVIRLSERAALQSAFADNALGKLIKTAAGEVSANATAPNLSAIGNHKLGSLVFNNSQVTIEADAQHKEQFAKVNGTINWTNLHASATIDLTADWRGEPVEFRSAVMKPLIFAAGGTSDVGLNFNSAPLELSFQGQSNIVSNFFADGKLSVKSPSMQRFLSWARAGSTAGEAIGDIELTATLTTKDGILFFDNVAMQVSGSPATGTLVIDPVAAPIKTSGTLAFKTVDLGSLGASLPIGLAPNQTTDLALLDAIDLDLRLSAEEAKVGPLTIANAAGAIRISKGEADLDLGTGTLGGGTVIGRLKLSGPANAKLGDLKMQMTNLRQDQLEDLAQNIPNHTGAISGKLALTGPYSGIQSFLEKANGALEVNTGLGLVRNFNLETFQDALGQKGFFELASVFQGVTEIKPVALTAQVKSGVAIVSPTDVLVGGRRVIVSGAVPFLSRGLALNGVIAGLPGEALDPNPLPFFIGGVWSKPLVTTTTSQ